MSNTSYSFKENSHMKEFQGGEKKVMKKILSVALSTAMAFSMFASVAFSAEKLTPQQQFDALKSAGIVTGYPDQTAGLEKTITRAELATIIVKAIDLEPVLGVATYKDPNYTAGHWAAKYIEAATQAGILTGKDAVKQLFGPNDNLTVQELAVVLVKALKLEVPAETNNTATEWAKGYVQAAINEGLIDSGINYQANATRSQAVVAAYAIWEANQIPTVASYEVSEAGKVVEFKLSNDDVVKVTLEEALAPNKETEVKFTHNGNEYTHKVTYVTTAAQTVQKVAAENLKQIVITFDGTVDAESAGNEDNYVVKDKAFHSATVSEDKTTVTLLLDNENASNYLTNQKEIELEIKNIKNEDGTKTFNQKVKFTPSDVTAPTVQEVTGLGTKAFKIKFSEPINPANATASSSYKVNGKSIGASIDFAFPDTVIVKTALPIGEHSVAVSNVSDFSGLRVAPVDNTFTVEEDTAAPEIVSAKTKDLKEVVVEFNETIKGVTEAYANTSSHKATRIVREDTKVRLFFNDPINYTENTIVLKGVSDYSDNRADREVKVTPTLDTVRPTVSEAEIKLESNGHYVAKVRFSESLHTDSLDRKNFVLKNSEGKIADVAGVDSNGHPHIVPTFNDSNSRVILIDLGFNLKSEKYTLTISNVKDTAAVANVIIPVTVDLDVAKVQNGEINRVWTESTGDATGDRFVYVEFNKELSTTGDGSALSSAKYKLLKKASGAPSFVEVGQLTDEDDNVEILTSKTVKIRTKAKVVNAPDETDVYAVKASYIRNIDGEYLRAGNSYDLIGEIGENEVKIKLDTIKAISRNEVKVEFDSAVSTLVDSDFSINGRAVTGTLAGDGKSATFKLVGDHKFVANAVGVKLETRRSLQSQNEYGIKVSPLVDTGHQVKDEIKPELVEGSLKIVPTATLATYELKLQLTEEVEFNTVHGNSTAVNDAFKIKALQVGKDYEGSVKNIIYGTGDQAGFITIIVEFKKDGVLVNDILPGASFVVELKDTNESAKYIVDLADNKNPLQKFSTSKIYN